MNGKPWTAGGAADAERPARLERPPERWRPLLATILLMGLAAAAPARQSGEDAAETPQQAGAQPTAEPQPADRPAELPAALREALSFAPPDAIGVIHLNLRVVHQILTKNEAAIRKAFKDVEGFGAVLDKVKPLLAKAHSADVFLWARGPISLVVIHGPVTPKDVAAFLASIPDAGLKLVAEGHGRHVCRAGEKLRFIFGAEAEDVPAGVVLLGSAEHLTGESVAALGSKKHGELAKLLTEDDLAAPGWMAVQVPKGCIPDGPEAIAGWVDPRGRGRLDLRVAFATADEAQQMEEIVSDGLARQHGAVVPWTQHVLRPLVRGRRDGRVLSLHRAPKAGTFVADLLTSIAHIRRVARQTASMANLRGIAQGIILYQAIHDDRFPPDLNSLIEDKLLTADMLISPLSGRKLTTDQKGVPTCPIDYVYIRYPDGSNPPAHLIIAYERPENYGGERTIVARVGGDVTILSAAEFHKQLEQTRAWLAEQSK